MVKTMDKSVAEALKTLRFQLGGNTYGMNQAFKEWFGNSKFVDAEGKPRVAYHGTATKGIEVFDTKKAQDKAGRKMGFGWGKGKFYLSTTEMGAQNAASGAQARGNGKTPTVMPVHLRMENPITAKEYNERFKKLSGGRDISGTSYDAEYTQAMRDKLIAKLDKALKKEGYDSILDEENGAVAVFDSNQIKSVDNQGTFSREDNNIYKQKSAHNTKDYGIRREYITEFSDDVTREDVESALSELAKVPLHNDIENEYAQINSKQRNKMASDKALGKSVSNGFYKSEHFSVAKSIKNVWKYAALAKDGPDEKNGKPDVNIRRYVSAIKKGDSLAFAWITAKKTIHGIRIYSVELMDEKKLRNLVNNGPVKTSANALFRSF